MLLNEGAGPVIALRRPPPLRRLLRREGDVPLRRPRRRPRRPRLRPARSPTTRCSSWRPSSSASRGARPTLRPHRPAARVPVGARARPGTIPAGALERPARRATRGSPRWSSRRSASRSRRRSSRRRRRSTSIPAAGRAEGRLPRARRAWARRRRWAASARRSAIDGIEVEFVEEVVGNSSPVESPLMDAIRDWVGEAEPGAEVVPTVLPALHRLALVPRRVPRLRRLRLLPARHMTLYEHVAADPRGRRADRRPRPRLRRALLRRAAEEAAGMSGTARSSASAAWRCATGCSCTGPTHWAAAVRTRRGRDQGRLGQQAAAARRRRRAGRARRRPARPRRWRSSRSSSAGCRRCSCRSRTSRCSAVAAGASLTGALRAQRVRGARRRVDRRASSRSRRRCSRCAAASSPQYHGVEHKAIAAYEQDDEDAGDAAKEHDRCGSHLVAPMLASNVAGTLLLRRALERPGPVAGGAVALASTAVAVEVFAWCERNAETRLAQALRRPGFEIQRADRHARARRAPARGRARRARGDPPRRGLELGPHLIVERRRLRDTCLIDDSAGRPTLFTLLAQTHSAGPRSGVPRGTPGTRSRTGCRPGPRSSSWGCSSSSSGGR